MCETFLCVHVNNCVYVIEVSEYDPLNLYINRRKQSIYLVVNCDGAALISLKHWNSESHFCVTLSKKTILQ